MAKPDSPFERGEMSNIRIHVLPTNRFKTYAISVYIGAPLEESSVTAHALIPFVLRRGNESYPETKQFREKLDDMYGAGFGFDIYKRGDNQLVQFRMDVVGDRFVESRQSLLKESIRFLGETITKPAFSEGRFPGKYVSAEKVTLQRRLEAIINDKVRYAGERCLEEMCKGEPYRLHPLGKLEDIAALSPDSLTSAYRNWLQAAPIDIYVAGPTTLDEVTTLVQQSFRFENKKAASYRSVSRPKRALEPKTVVERMEVSQGKLNMGLRIDTSYAANDYPAALMYNGILGAFPHSKLFTNVREKASLAYYASSRLDGHKGILTIQSGIEIANYEKAVEIIKQQLESMREGEISELELSQTRAMIANQLRESLDSAYEMIAFDFNAVLSGRVRTVPELIESIDRVGVSDIRAVADQVQLDTIYFLTDRKEG